MDYSPRPARWSIATIAQSKQDIAAAFPWAARQYAEENTRRAARRARFGAALSPASDGSELPHCPGFTGHNQRCESCRIHRRIHA